MWAAENLDNLVSKYVRQGLDLPISATLSCIILTKHQFSLNLILPSFKFAQCHTVLNVTKLIWTSVQSKMPKNIYSFTIRYLNNSLLTRSNMKKMEFHTILRLIFLSSARDTSSCCSWLKVIPRRGTLYLAPHLCATYLS